MIKTVEWLGTTRRDIRELPDEMQDAMGTDLLDVQYGGRPESVKTFDGAILEIRQSDQANTYRLVYIAKFEEAVYVLHVFTKKSTSGIATPKRDTELIYSRYADAQRLHSEAARNKEKKQ